MFVCWSSETTNGVAAQLVHSDQFQPQRAAVPGVSFYPFREVVVLTIGRKPSVMYRLCVAWIVVMGAWFGLTGVHALGAEPLRSHPLPVSRQARSHEAARMVADAPNGNARLRTEKFTRNDETGSQFTESDVVREGYLDEEFLPPTSIRPGQFRAGEPESSRWIKDGIVEDSSSAALPAGLPRRVPVCLPRCLPRRRDSRARRCSTSRLELREEGCAGDLATVPPPACRCSLCRQLPQGCRCRANRTVFPPDRIRSLRSNPGFGQFDETPGEVNIAPRGDEFATPWTESPPFRSKSSPELPMPAQSNGKVWQFPGTALPLSARPLMRPTHHVRPVAVSPRPRYEPVFGDESDFVPELSLPE